MPGGEDDTLSFSADVIRVSVRLGQTLHPIAGQARVSLILRSGSTVGDVADMTAHRYPELGDALRSALSIVDGAQAERERKLSDGDEVAFLAPTAGG